MPFLSAINHSSLMDLDVGDDHPQYVKLSVNSSSRNVLTCTVDDAITLTVRSGPFSDTGSTALLCTNSVSDTIFSVGDSIGIPYVGVHSNLFVNSSICFSAPPLLPAGNGYILATRPGAANAGYLNLSATSTNAGGYITTAGGASGAGGNIDTSNGGGSITTSGSGSIGLGVSGTRTTLNGSGSTVTCTLPATTTTLMGLAGAQTVTGAKTFNSTTCLLRNSGNTASATLATTASSARTMTFPDLTGTVITASSTSTTANHLCFATATAGGVSFKALSGDGTIDTSAVLTIANNAVSLAKMATMATASLLGRNTAGTGNVEVLSVSTAKTMLSLNLVENTALSTWTGSTNITTLGTISALKFGDGTLTAPGAAFGSDADLGLYRYAANTLGIAAGGASSCLKSFNNDGLTIENASGNEETYLGIFDNSYFSDYVYRVGYDYGIGGFAVNHLGCALVLNSSPFFFKYASAQLCEFAAVYDLGLGDEFYVGPYNDSAGTITGVNVNVRYGRGNAVGSIIQIDGANQTLDATGLGMKLKRTATATSYTATSADYIIAVTSTAAARTITLPAVAGTMGRVYVVKDESGGAGTNNITIDGNASETIDGATTKVINTNYGTATIYSNGSAWFSI